MSRRGYPLIADSTGYTMFLTQSELEDAHGILEAMFNISRSTSKLRRRLV